MERRDPPAAAASRARVRRGRLVLAALLTLLGAGALAGCGDTVGFDAGGGDRQRGRELFIESCGGCHELADAGTTGTVGPNLDYAFYQYRVDASGADPDDPDFQAQLADPGVTSTVRNTVRGQIAYPVTDPPSGLPGMPADILEGQDADDVAAYVASVAGLGGDGGPPQSGGGGGDGGGGGGGDGGSGKDVFAAAGCGSCHTLADAGASGTVGPNLDEARPSRELAVDRVTNGRGGMPSFEGQLSAEEIAAVAEYVSSVAGS
jgi:mono/diheme cytochrome c family protein